MSLAPMGRAAAEVLIYDGSAAPLVRGREAQDRSGELAGAASGRGDGAAIRRVALIAAPMVTIVSARAEGCHRATTGLRSAMAVAETAAETATSSDPVFRQEFVNVLCGVVRQAVRARRRARLVDRRRSAWPFMPPAELCRTGLVWHAVITLAPSIACTAAPFHSA